MPNILFAIATLAGFAVLAWRWGARRAVAITFLVVAMLFPRNLFELGPEATPDGYDVGLAATAGPAITTHGVILLVAAFTVGRRAWDALSLLAVVFLAIGTILWWPSDPHVLGGVIYLATAVCCWVVGRALGAEGLRGQVYRTLVVVTTALVVAEAALQLWQIATGRVDVNGRPAGTFDHAAVVGKNAVVLLLILLPATRGWTSARTSLAWVGVAAAVAATLLSGSRANSLAVVLTLLVWIFLLPRSVMSVRRKVGLLAVLAAAVLPTLPFFVARLQEDPDGGDRPELRDAGLRVISEHPWTGTGPNNYAHVAAQTESIVQQTGYPPHNVLLFGLAELGIIGTVIFAGFVVAPLLRGLRITFTAQAPHASDVPRAAFAVFIGLIPVAATGWGLVGRNTLLLLMFVVAYIYSAMKAAQDRPVAFRSLDQVTPTHGLVHREGR
ncbi:O-antigen ligase family protein [Microbacterium sp.]|uniref:O-antigen ligase family protein n=1 Tax=Microbacterium sp. TaxID=51671 RepID=UPI003A839C07